MSAERVAPRSRAELQARRSERAASAHRARTRRRWLALTAAVLVTALVVRGGRDGEPASGAEPGAGRAVTIVWGGDAALSAAAALPADGRAGLSRVAGTLMATDLAMVNLEGTLGTSGTSKCAGAQTGSCFAFQAPPGVARELAYAGVDAVNLANNHSFEAGAVGVSETTAALDASEVAWTGLTGAVRVLRPAGVPVALVGVAPYRWSNDLRDLAVVTGQVRAAARRSALVVVTMHAGREAQDATETPVGREVAFGEDRGDTRAAAHAAIDAGADLVLGSGPHVVRGIERYRGRLIAYSTGNLAANGTVSLSGRYATAALIRVRLTADGRPLSGRVVPLALTPPGLPARDPRGAAIAVMDQTGREDFGAAGVPIDGRGVLRLGARRR